MLTHNITNKYIWKIKDLFFQNIVKENFSQELNKYFALRKKIIFNELSLNADINNSKLLNLLPSPWTMKDIQKAAQRIITAIQKQEKITIFGDYDVDGTISCAMLREFFAALNYTVNIYIPDRVTEGYGLNSVGVKKLFEDGTKLIITVDNGIAAHEACKTAKDFAIDVIITDHHEVPSQLPIAYAILNPKQIDCKFPAKMLAGVGVAYYLIIVIRALLREQAPNSIPDTFRLKTFLDFVAIGTIADMAPLNGTNHILCKIGLEVLAENLKLGKRAGICELLKLSGWKINTKVTETDVGFKIGPKLNAAGRLGNALNAVNVAYDSDDIAHSITAAQNLHAENIKRQNLEKKCSEEALQSVQLLLPNLPNALTLYNADWHIGVVGLVASKILERYYRPTVVFTAVDGKLKGSGRSTHSFNLFAALEAVKHEFIAFGGHFHAVGLTMDCAKLAWFTDYLNTKAGQLIAAEDKIPHLNIDGKISLAQVDKNFLQELDSCAPYGIANARAKWLCGPLQIRYVKRIGKDLSKQHARILFLENQREFWLTAFGMADAFEKLLANGLDVELILEIKANIWNNREVIDFNIIDFAPVVYKDDI